MDAKKPAWCGLQWPRGRKGSEMSQAKDKASSVHWVNVGERVAARKGVMRAESYPILRISEDGEGHRLEARTSIEPAPIALEADVDDAAQA